MIIYYYYYYYYYHHRHHHHYLRNDVLQEVKWPITYSRFCWVRACLLAE